MRRWLNDLGSIVLALCLATIVWMVAMREENPFVRGAWAEAIPIELVNRPEGMLIVGEVPTQVRVTIRAPQSSWQDLRRESFRAQVDLSQAVVGMNQLDVQVECSDKNVEIVERRPSTVSVRMEKSREITLPVRVVVLDSPPYGYEVRYEEITTDPQEVIVTGPEQLVSEVSQVVADFYLRGATETQERRVTLRARDAQGDVVDVTLSPPTAIVKVLVVQRSGFRNVSVRVVWDGQPAAGYRISNVSLEPTIVTVTGDPEALEAIPGYLETAPVDVEDADEDVIQRVALILPEGVSLLGAQTVQVHVSVTPIESSLTIRRDVIIQGLSPDLLATVSPASLDVILSGPLPKLDTLRAEDVQVVVNLFDLAVGSYQVSPIIIPPEGITVQSVLPEKLQVDITWRITPTPAPVQTPVVTETPTPAPSPTATAQSG